MILEKAQKVNKKKNLLKDIEILEVSSANRGVNEGARVSLLKAVVVDKAVKTEDGKKFPASDYAHVPDPDKPSTWKLRLTSVPGGDPDPRIVGAAVAALGPGFRSQKVQLPSEERSKVIARVKRAWLAANPDKDSKDMPSLLRKSKERYDMDLEEKVKKLEALNGELTDKLAKSEFQAALSDSQKAHYENLNSDEKKTFEKASSGERDKIVAEAIAKARAAEEIIEIDGSEIRKSEVGAMAFGLLKKTKAEKEQLRKEKEAEIAKAAQKQLEEDAEKEFPSLSGSPESKAKLLKSAREDAELMKVLKGADASAAALTGEVGKSSAGTPEGQTNFGTLETLAKSKAEKDNISYAVAYAEILKTKEGAALYEGRE